MIHAGSLVRYIGRDIRNNELRERLVSVCEVKENTVIVWNGKNVSGAWQTSELPKKDVVEVG